MNDVRNCLLLLCICICISTHSEAKAVKPVIRPVILVPGDGGSRLEFKDKKGVWKPLWVSMKMQAELDDFVDITRLHYDPKTKATHNEPGVEIRVPDFGNTSAVEYLTRKADSISQPYFFQLVDFLCRNMSYVRGVSVRAAPYDFRKAANEMGEYYTALKQLVEDTYEKNNKERVVLLAHSMGNLNTLYFLNHQTQAWKDKYIRTFISIAAPYGGAINALMSVVSGYDPSTYFMEDVVMRRLFRSMPSHAWILPYDTFWNKTEILVYAPTGNYTVGDYKKLFKDVEFKNGLLMREDTEGLIKKLEAPGVEVHCLYGTGVKTPDALRYKLYPKQPDLKWYDENPYKTVDGDGDGTVNLRSLKACLRWPKVQHREFKGIDHTQSIQDAAVLQYVAKLLRN